ncbi:MM3350-like domain-containing protein [Flagelloscypha sp. PMI_526]|nr:MM3350-like domain-containing protein [Flagelloscypha sp. PMI_526]
MPRPLIPEYPERSKCRAMLCQNDGTKACSRCKTKYCSAKCQQSDWKYHKTYCGKMVYTFKFKLLGSRDPVITRTVDVPAWWSFQQLHFVIQYAFGPWEQCHLHEFSYSTSKPNNSGIISLAPDQTVLKICSGDGAPQSMFGEPVPKFFFEKEIMLKDIYDVKGKHRSLVESASDGNLLPLVYLYDFGDHWEHLIAFKSEKLAKADRPLFSKAKGALLLPTLHLCS